MRTLESGSSSRGGRFWELLTHVFNTGLSESSVLAKPKKIKKARLFKSYVLNTVLTRPGCGACYINNICFSSEPLQPALWSACQPPSYQALCLCHPFPQSDINIHSNTQKTGHLRRWEFFLFLKRFPSLLSQLAGGLCSITWCSDFSYSKLCKQPEAQTPCPF